MDHDRPGRRSSSGRAVEERAVAWLAARRTLIDPGDVGPDEVPRSKWVGYDPRRRQRVAVLRAVLPARASAADRAS